MKCAWESLLQVIPQWMRPVVDKLGKEKMQELRLRLGKPPELLLGNESIWLNQLCQMDDLNYVINTASRYSPWASESIRDGYLTAAGGHRIGICGKAVVHDGGISGIRQPESLCIRVARDFPGVADALTDFNGSILIIGPPGSGKTTLLRDLIRQLSQKETVAVVDERSELFPSGAFEAGKRLDVLTGCPKREGILMVLRTMGPTTIGVDEITAQEDCEALTHAGWCGVRLLATVHGGNLQDLKQKSLYKPLWEAQLFDHYIVLDRNKRIHEERMTP